MELEARKAVLAALAGNTALGAVSKWYKDIAQGTILYPYGIISLNVGGRDHRYQGVKLADLRYLVKVVGKQQTPVDELAGLIEQSLDEATLTAAAPWYAWRCQQVAVVSFSEKDAEQIFYHAGGIFRVRLSS